jgi:hypothetical protein
MFNVYCVGIRDDEEKVILGLLKAKEKNNKCWVKKPLFLEFLSEEELSELLDREVTKKDLEDFRNVVIDDIGEEVDRILAEFIDNHK